MSDIVERLTAPFATDGVILSFPNGQTDMEGLRDACREAAAEITRLRAEVERLRVALKPLATLYHGVSMLDDAPAAFTVVGQRSVDNTVIRAGDIRRAREAMGEKG